MSWDIKVTEINCPYYYAQYQHNNCGNVKNTKNKCNEGYCPLRIKPFVPPCFGELYNTLPISDCEGCSVYNQCETESLNE